MAQEKTVLLTDAEINDLICGCCAQISDYCTCKEDKVSFEALIEKLESYLEKE